MGRRRIRNAQELARVHRGWTGTGEPVTARTAAGAAAAGPRRVYTEMSKFPVKTFKDIELTDCMWLEDSTQAGAEAGQYAITIDSLWQLFSQEQSAALYGTCANFSMGTSMSVMNNFTNSQENGVFVGATDAVAGTITMPAIDRARLFTVETHLYGTQGNDTKEEMMRLWVRINNAVADPDLNGDHVVDLFDVTTDKTYERIFTGPSFQVWLSGGEVFQLAANATSGMGTFTVLRAMLELKW